MRGHVAKFQQHEPLAVYLRGTGTKVLVEAAPHDLIWGIGMGESDPDARSPARWRGQNLLGFALMDYARSVAGTSHMLVRSPVALPVET